MTNIWRQNSNLPANFQIFSVCLLLGVVRSFGRTNITTCSEAGMGKEKKKGATEKSKLDTENGRRQKK